ncbi:MAG: phosphoribosylformylglycinamidine cyclo-ligase [Acidimicrobiales bacterium]
MGETYAGAGVSIGAGEQAVERIGAAVRSTRRSGVVGGIGGFGGLFDLQAAGHPDSMLVSSTDGVGTKAMVATAARRFDTIGIDLVAMCVDDLVCQGAEPLFFLDYVSIGVLDPDMVETLVAGVAEGCRQAGCALVGGEMAEHPGAMAPGEFDLVGFAVGAVARSAVITGEAVSQGDVLVALPSPNLRSNGFSLARRLYFEIAGAGLDDPAWAGASATVADELLEPSVIYAPAVLAAREQVDVHGVAHITGGGLPGNVVRVLGDDVDAVIDPGTWEPPRVFDELARIGSVSPDEMRRTFNCGLGMVLAVPSAQAAAAVSVFDDLGHRARIVGEVTAGTGRVRFTDDEDAP